MSHKCLIIIISWDKFFRLYICLFPQLVDRVFDESLNFRKIPPVIPTNKPPEINGKPPELRPRAPDSLEPRALRRRTWNREDVRAVAKIKAQTEIHLLTCCYQTCAPVCVQAVLDSLLLNSVSQLSSKIRHSVDKTAGKIRSLCWLTFTQHAGI